MFTKPCVLPYCLQDLSNSGSVPDQCALVQATRFQANWSCARATQDAADNYKIPRHRLVRPCLCLPLVPCLHRNDIYDNGHLHKSGQFTSLMINIALQLLMGLFCSRFLSFSGLFVGGGSGLLTLQNVESTKYLIWKKIGIYLELPTGKEWLW